MPRTGRCRRSRSPRRRGWCAPAARPARRRLLGRAPRCRSRSRSSPGPRSALRCGALAMRTPPTTPPLTSIRSGQPKVTATTGGSSAPSASPSPSMVTRTIGNEASSGCSGASTTAAWHAFLADAPEHGAGLGAFGRDLHAALERIDVGRHRQRSKQRRHDRPLTHRPTPPRQPGLARQPGGASAVCSTLCPNLP